MLHLQDDAHVVVPLVGEGGRPLRNSERFAAYGALLFAAIQYPFSTQEVVADSESRSFFCGSQFEGTPRVLLYSPAAAG